RDYSRRFRQSLSVKAVQSGLHALEEFAGAGMAREKDRDQRAIREGVTAAVVTMFSFPSFAALRDLPCRRRPNASATQTANTSSAAVTPACRRRKRPMMLGRSYPRMGRAVLI